MAKNSNLKILAALAVTFTGLGVTIIILAARQVVGLELALLMLVALVGLHLGLGVLILVYRFIGKLD